MARRGPAAIPIYEVEPLLLLFNLFTLLGTIGSRDNFVVDQPATGLDKAVIAFSIISEIVTGKVALTQLNIETSIPVTEIESLVLFNLRCGLP
ncbi:hypothetical protein OsJ_17329 [Oryza sativa Japonica Group]|uniref:Uncharacterized protein n=1 Tax=Oryza sativa subsp. japonica TaxID=39947 RepID=B9FMS6_ORYSJ|nr:hypothetical protein OsJ_17329 [Oryza sativa Japonica Group]